MSEESHSVRAMPPGFEGGTVELWEREHISGGQNGPDDRYFRSAPARAILHALEDRARPVPGSRAVELGCGNSRWLALLASRSGVQVHGVDFSPTGVQSARERLMTMGIDASGIQLGSIDDYVQAHAGRFDLVISFGLIEHFFDLDVIVSAHTRCARPGGRIFVTAPNLSKLNLHWAQLVAGDIFVWHRPISANLVAASFERHGCTEVTVDYLGGPRWFACPTPEGLPNAALRHLASLSRKAWNAAGEGLYRASERVATRAAGEWLSPHFAVSAIVTGR